MQKKEVTINIPITKVVQICSIINIWLKYGWPLNHRDNKAIVNLELQDMKIYWKLAT